MDVRPISFAHSPSAWHQVVGVRDPVKVVDDGHGAAAVEDVLEPAAPAAALGVHDEGVAAEVVHVHEVGFVLPLHLPDVRPLLARGLVEQVAADVLIGPAYAAPDGLGKLALVLSEILCHLLWEVH